MADFTDNKDFEKMIGEILDIESDGKTLGVTTESELVQFINGPNVSPFISTKIPTRKEMQERSDSQKKSPAEEVVQEVHLPAHEDVYFKQGRNVNEKIIYVNREKDKTGDVKKDLAIYGIDTDFIQDIRKGVTERIPEVFKTFTPFKHDAQKTAAIKKQIEVLVKSANNVRVPPSVANIDAIADEIMGLGPLSLLTTLPDVTEIMVVDYDNIYVEMEGMLQRVQNVKFKDRQHLASVIERMVGLMGESINFEKPILDMRLSDGSRVNIVGPPITEDDLLYLLTIRRFRDTRFTLPDLLRLETISVEMYQYLSNIMKARANVLLCGGTGSGKTATLEALLMEKDPNECVVTVEDTRELMLNRQNWRPMKSKRSGSDNEGKDIDIRKLVKAALRMRPDSIIVGETRDATAYDILFAMNSGHEGCCTTVHANTGIQSLSKFEMLAKLAKDEAPPTDALREIIVECFDVVISIGRTPEGYRKMMTVDEVTGYDETRHKYTVMNVFRCIQINSNPDLPSEYRFIPNPDYFTTETLAFKMKRWGLPFVPPKDGVYPSGSSVESTNIVYINGVKEVSNTGPISGGGHSSKKKTRQNEWDDIERRAEKSRMEVQQKAEREKIRALKAAQKETAKIKRLQEKDRFKLEQLASRELRLEEAKIESKENREKSRLERQLRMAAEKRERQEAVRRDRQKNKIVKEMKQEQIKEQREEMQKILDSNYQEVWNREYDKAISDGLLVGEAQQMAALAAIAAKMEMEENLEKITPWAQKNLSRAVEYQKYINEDGMSPEKIAETKGVSVNNILKYLNIVNPIFVREYRSFLNKNRTKKNSAQPSEFELGFDFEKQTIPNLLAEETFPTPEFETVVNEDLISADEYATHSVDKMAGKMSPIEITSTDLEGIM